MPLAWLSLFGEQHQLVRSCQERLLMSCTGEVGRLPRQLTGPLSVAQKSLAQLFLGRVLGGIDIAPSLHLIAGAPMDH